MDVADLVVINTCAIRESAEAKVVGRQGHLGRLKTANPGMRVVMTGCSVRESNRAGLARRYPAVDLFLRPDEEPELVDRLGLASAQAPVGTSVATAATTLVKGAPVSDATHLVRARAAAVEGDAVNRSSAISAWLPIIYGCDKTCTYCIVPFSRGPERSRPFDEIVDEARVLAAQGFREVTLLGQNVNCYGHDLAAEPRFAHVSTTRTVGRHLDREARPDLAELIRAVDALRAADGKPGHPTPAVRDIAPVGPLRPPGRGDGELSERLRVAPPAGPVRLRLDAPAHGPPVHDRPLPRARGPDPCGRARHLALDGRHRRLLRRDRRRVRGHARPPAHRPLRPGVRGGLQRAARHAGHEARRRRPGRREATTARRAPGRAGDDRARAEPCVAGSDHRSPRGHDRATPNP